MTPNLDWTVSLSPDCGDFVSPPVTDPQSKCYMTYGPDQGSGLSWVVTPQGSPVSSVCNLHRGTTYYLNIAPGALGTDHSTACPDSTCMINLKHGGNF